MSEWLAGGWSHVLIQRFRFARLNLSLTHWAGSGQRNFTCPDLKMTCRPLFLAVTIGGLMNTTPVSFEGASVGELRCRRRWARSPIGDDFPPNAASARDQ